ncbi:MAG: hypothetical protein MUP22_02415 [Desulfobacterales bacterium]|nr:hypothetical protein [Desulfobacterales bacterium]
MNKSFSLSLAALVCIFALSLKADTREQALQLVEQNKTDLISLETMQAKIVNNFIQEKNLVNEYKANLDASINLIQSNLQNVETILTAIRQIQRITQRFNMQSVALQEAIQKESRNFQTLSNICKMRHDAAMNAVRNIK